MNIDFDKYADGLVPAIVQDSETGKVLMLGYMNEEAVGLSVETGRLTFYSRSKGRLWTKGETSGNFLNLRSIQVDCDRDALLIKARPVGPVCHKGTDTCWGEENTASLEFLNNLEAVIDSRRALSGESGSYVSSLFEDGINKIAQKVGEEAVELVIEAKDDDRERFLDEAADLLFHYVVLLRAKDSSLSEIVSVLQKRHKG